jgi:integrase
VDRKAKQTGKFWECRTETASRVRGRMEVILDWCKGRGHRSGDNPAAWKGNLDAQLPKPERVRRVAHYPAVQLDQMGAFMTDLRQREGVTARALEFAVLCAARSGEVRGMRWGEIDAATGVWTVPADRMKAKQEHRVPLSKPALELLAGLPRIEGNDLVFPAPRGGELSDMGLNAIMRRMDYVDRDGRKAVPHGCRSTFRDWVAERTNYPRDLAEMALAHAIGNQVEAAYRRGDMMEKRRSMMQAWADFCAVAVRNDNVVGIGHKKTAA